MTQTESCSILLADDDRNRCTSLCDVLESMSHRVEIVYTGGAALAACERQAYDVLLLDVTLPDLSGLELISRIEELRPELEILVITGHATLEGAVQAVSRSTIGYLVKPLDLDRLLAILDGIAQRKRIAEENRRLLESIEMARRQWASTFHAISDPLVIVGADGNVRRANQAFCERFETTLEDVIGRPAGALIFDPATAPRATAGEVANPGADPAAGAGKGCCPALPAGPAVEERDDLATPGIFEMACDPVDLEDERGTICVLRDITARKRAEADREELIRELAAKNAELEQYTYTVSHDLKSPLITIGGFLGAVSQGIEEGKFEQVRSDIGRIETAAEHMTRLLDELLELSRIGRMVNPPEDVDLSDLARQAADLVSRPAVQRPLGGRGGDLRDGEGAAVDYRIAGDLPVVRGDRIRLFQVFQNLIENGLKFMGEESAPRIEIGVRTVPAVAVPGVAVPGVGDGGETVLYVRDNGIGIDSRDQERIFGLFHQLDRSSRGTGIGLALVQKIVKVHGGRIWAESAGRGQGSCFCFTLPGNEDPEA